MPISFACPKCGKSLKAPDSAAGKSSTCPGCSSRVTCPEPVYDAELVEAGPSALDIYGDIGDEKPYAMTPGPADAPAPGTEARKPCPMCGEMIVVSAAKCRFCGEIFDPAVKKAARSGKGGKKGKFKGVPAQQRNLVIFLLIEIAGNVTFASIRRNAAGGPDGDTSLVALCALAAVMVGAIGMIVYTYLLASKFYSTVMGVILAILTVVPCLNLIIPIVVYQRASNELKAHGY
jgi:hypothetical protein